MRRYAVLSILMVTVLVFSAGGAMAYGDSSKVILTCPSGTVDAGDDVDVEVNVFDKGQYASPTVVQAFDYDANEISLTEKKTGVWTGKVEAQDDVVTANIEINELSDTNALPLQVVEQATVDEMDIDIEAKDPSALSDPRPGDKIDFTITVYKNGALKDEASLEVHVFRSDTYDDTKLAINKINTGTYETSYTVPQVTTSTYFHISAEASQGGMTYSSSTSNFWVNFFQVWYKKQTISTTEATFDIYVADLDGKAVEGAVVNLEYMYEQTDTWNDVHEDAGQATTDKAGKASYTITYTKVDREVYLDGSVQKDSNTQDFSGDIIITPDISGPDDQPDEPIGWDFEVIYQGSEMDTLKPGKSSQVIFKAYYTEGFWGNTEPWVEKDVYYYVHTYTKIVTTGKVTTDADGLFTLNVQAPSISGDYDIMVFDFETETNTDEFSSAAEYMIIAEKSALDYLDNPELLRDKDLKISVDQLKIGGTSKITATLSKAKAGTTASVAWVPGKLNIKDMMDWGDSQPDWEYLSGEGSYEMSKKGSTFSTSIVIPEFMPKTTYTIFVIAIDPYDSDSFDFNIYDAFHVNYIQLQAGEGGSTNNGGGTPGGMLGLGEVAGIDVAYLLIVIVVIIAMLVIIVVVVSRRSRSTLPPPQQPMGPHAQPPPAQPTQPVAQPPPQQPPPVQHGPPPEPPTAQPAPPAEPPPPAGGEYQPPPPPVDPFLQKGQPPPS